MKKWERSPIHPNVIIVNVWRNRQMNEDMRKAAEKRDAETVRKLCPPWRQFMLDVHGVITRTAAFVWSPVTALFEHFNGTAEMRAVLARMEAEEKKALAQAG